MDVHNREFHKDNMSTADTAELLFGDRSQTRKVYHLAATSRLPVWRLGSRIYVRRSVLMEWIQTQEGRARDKNISTAVTDDSARGNGDDKN
jgi:hypothetical protein